MQVEGGFQGNFAGELRVSKSKRGPLLSGRTNKLVDSCYSFWQGALFPLVSLIDGKRLDIGVE